MQRKILTAAAALVATFGITAQALGEATPEDAYDYREAIMTAMRGHIGAASMIVRGLIDNNGQLLAHAEALANGAAEIGSLFPEGSNTADSEALPAIWEQPEKFAEAVARAEDATMAFEEAVAGGDPEAIGAAFREVGMACRGCHDDFRKSDE